MANERDFEEVLARYPEIIEDGLRLIGRQVVVCGRRIDLLFEDRFNQKLVVELKWGPIKDEHVGQVMYYQGALISSRGAVRTMLIGTRVPPAIQRGLDFNGLASKEIQPRTLIEFLRSKADLDLIPAFEADLPLSEVAQKTRPSPKVPVPVLAPPTKSNGSPALLALVKTVWLEKAFAHFEGGAKELYFGSGSNGLAPARTLAIENVYFKMTGENEISARARFLSIEIDNPSKKRLPDNKDETAKFYYGFSGLSWTKTRIPLASLHRYSNGKPLRNDVTGACVIKDIAIG